MQTISEALTGKTQPEMGTDQFGNQYVKQTALTGAQRWARIATEAAVGAARGFAAGKGGNPGAAAAAGVDTGLKFAQQRQEQQQNMTVEARQQNLDRANNQLLTQKIAEQSLAMKRLEIQGTQEAIDFSEKQQDWMAAHSDGGEPLFYASNLKDLAQGMNNTPGFHDNHVGNSLLQPVQVYDKDGKAAGFAVYQMKAGFNNDMLPAGTTVYHYDGVNDKLIPQQTSQPMKALDVFATNNAAAAAMNDAHMKAEDLKNKKADTLSKQEEVPLKKAQAAKAYSDAAKDRAETTALNNAASSNEIQGNAVQLVEGSMDPSNLSRRSKSYDSTLAAANTYSLQKYGVPFDVAKAMGDYKFATNPQTYNVLNYLNSLTGRDNQSGNLGIVVQMSDKLGQTQFPALNNVEQWAKISAGNPQVAAYRAALVETSDQIAKILQGGGSGGGATSDAKLRQAGELLDKSFNAAQIRAVASDTLRPLLANRKQEIIGTNRYLQQWHGGGPPAQQQVPTQPPPIAPNTPPPATGMKRVWAPGMTTWKDVPAAAVKADVPGQVVQ
jgi:hypothetical protein